MKYYILIILLGSLAFSNALQNSFVWDDNGLILTNRDIDLPLSRIPLLFARPLWNLPDSVSVYYRPLVNLLLVINYKLWGLNPVGFHLVNLLTHVTVALLLFQTGKLLFEKEGNRDLLSFIAASVFAVHPVNNEHIGRAVTGEPLLGLFMLLSLYFFLKDQRYRSLAVFSLALLTKETAVMLPFALLILSVHKEGIRKGGLAIVPYLLLTMVYLVIRMLTVRSVLGDVFSWSSIHARVLTMAVASYDYLRLLVIPWPLSPFHPARSYTSVFEPKVVAAFAVLSAVLFLSIRFRRDRPMLFLLLFPLLMLAPVILKVNTMGAGRDFMYIAERYLYLPSMAYSLLFAAVAVRTFEKTASFPRGAMITLGITILVLLPITLSANPMWKNNITLYGKITVDFPRVAFAHHGLGDAYRDAGRLDLALLEWERALVYDPGNPLLLNSVGNCYALLGDYGRAVAAYRTAIQVYPEHVESLYNLAMALEKSGRQAEADEYYRKFMGVAPSEYGDIVADLKKRGLNPGHGP